ncbi:MAG: hypothetical protein ACREXV_14730, partial [Polaromonas sp.]
MNTDFSGLEDLHRRGETAPDLLAPQLTPRGSLLAMAEDDAPPLAEEVRQGLGRSFALGAGHGLLHLGTAEIGRILPPA